MGFRSVYRTLTELFPQIDPKSLSRVALEHQHDADEAASVVISEMFPLSCPSSTQPRNKNKNKNKISEYPPNLKLERDMQTDDGSSSLSQWLQPSKLPHSYLSLLNEESTPDVKPLQDYVVKKVVLPNRGAATGVGEGVRGMYSFDSIGGSSSVKPSIRVQSRTNNELSGSSGTVPVGRRSSQKSVQPLSPGYSEKLRSWKKRSNNNNSRDFSQFFDEDRDVPSKKSKKNNYKSYNNERERKLLIAGNIKALGELLPHKVEEDNPQSTVNAIIAHVKLLHLQMKELSRSRLGGEPVSNPMTFIEGYGHFIRHEQIMTKSLEEVMEDLLTNDFDAAANLLVSKGLYLMPVSSAQGSC